jgi:hypothetical protein
MPTSLGKVRIFGGGPVLPIESFSEGVGPQSNDYTLLMDATVASRVVTLPPCASFPGRIYSVKRIDASGNAVTIVTSGADTIDGLGLLALTSLQSVLLQSDGHNLWSVIASNGIGGGPGTPTPEAATFVVSPNPGVGDFTTIEAAVAAAPAAGADIYLREGTYAPVGTIVLPIDRAINIRGAGIDIAQITVPAGVPLFSVAAGSTVDYTFSGFNLIGDGSAGQGFLSIASLVDFYVDSVEISNVRGIVVTTAQPNVTFTNCHFAMFGTGWTFWNGSGGPGRLVWNYVTVTVGQASPTAMVGSPEWFVTTSYIGGPGFSVYAVGHALWQGLRVDFGDFTISGSDNKIDECEFQNVGINITGDASIVSDSLFFGAGSTSFQLRLSGTQNAVTGCLFNGGAALGIDVLVAATDTVVTGCRFFIGYFSGALRTASVRTVATGNNGLVVVETGAADNNIFEDIDATSTIIGPSTIVNNAKKYGQSAGATTGAFVTLFTHVNPKGLLGIGTIKNTGGVNDLQVRETVTDAFGVTDATTITTVNPGNSYMLDVQTNFGAARPPYVSYAVAVQHPVAATTFDIQHTDTGAQL